MAPVDAEMANSNVKPLFLLGSHAILIITLLVTITRFISFAHRNTPPALHTRHKHAAHKYGIWLFAILTSASLAVSTYHGLAWRYASYMHWASESRVDVPGSLLNGWYTPALKARGGKGSWTGWQLGRWMDDTDLVSETNMAGFGDASGFWWTYQEFVGLIVWSVFVGIEGRHRNFPQHISFSFVLLAQLASLSTAQNLFFILLLLTPMPLGDGSPASKRGTAHPALLSIPSLLSFVVLSALPKLHEHSLFATATSLVFFMPLLLVTLAQPSVSHKQSKYASPAEARRSYEDVFRALALASFGLHGYFTYKAVAAETIPHRYFRHNFVWNTHENVSSGRIWTTVVNILSRLSENPVMSQVGWDVVFSGISSIVWTVVHGVDPTNMLRCSALAWTLPTMPTLPNVQSIRTKQAQVMLGQDLDDLSQEIQIIPSPKKRGRPRKVSSAAIANDHVASQSVSSSGTLKRSTHSRGESESLSFDDEYVPSKKTRDEVEQYDVDASHETGAVKETEAAALGWGLFILGGLGAVSASVLGAVSTSHAQLVQD